MAIDVKLLNIGICTGCGIAVCSLLPKAVTQVPPGPEWAAAALGLVQRMTSLSCVTSPASLECTETAGVRRPAGVDWAAGCDVRGCTAGCGRTERRRRGGEGRRVPAAAAAAAGRRQSARHTGGGWCVRERDGHRVL